MDQSTFVDEFASPQPERYKSTLSLVLNKSNISSEGIVLLNNNAKVSLVLNAYMK